MMTLPAETRMAGVSLDVGDLDALTAFYRDVLLLDVITAAGDEVSLGKGGEVLITLRHRPGLPRGVRRTAGLFHTALLHPDQASLAAALASVALHASHLYTGSGDHLVSQAFYLDDPEGNGVELYHDRPRSDWSWQGGRVKMATLYIDPSQFIRGNITPEARNYVETAPDARGALTGIAGQVVGHVHLKVGRTEAAKYFYSDLLGFDVTAEMPGALFVSAGGYHHHMAMNTWQSEGVGLRAPARGLGRVDIALPDADAVLAVDERLRAAALLVRRDGSAIEVDDPWGNLVRIAA
jgi:catechol 2,3-dioxygenase